ncbi:MAG: hypothetical protein HDT01_04065 [Bacteroidales bacterium]|nr:hypothetical protein [Bacteroidales bacterium]
MKKKVLSLAIALIATGAVMSAQTAQTSDNTTKTEQTEKKCNKKDGEKCCNNKDAKKGNKKGHKNHSMNKGNKQGKRPDMFQGIELTADQQTALKNLREQNRKDSEQAKQERKAMDQKAREERMAKRDAELKKILTPEQYTKYQANIEELKAKRANRQGGERRGNRI